MHNVLSIQSAVAYGHAGNSAAVFPMQRAGVNVWPVYTVNFSNHTGYGAWRGPMISAQDVGEVVQGIDDLGMLATADAVLTGYLGSAEVGNAILAAAKTVKTRNPAALFCADPVMGDVDRGFYARPGIPEFMRDELVGKADIMTPNLFELEFLTGRATTSLADVQASVAELRAAGPKTVLVTSVVASDVPQDKMWMLAVDDDGSWLVETPRLERTFTGSGDLTTATFLTHLLRTGDLAAALSMTASVVYSVLEVTTRKERQELALVEAQEHIVSPGYRFEASKVS